MAGGRGNIKILTEDEILKALELARKGKSLQEILSEMNVDAGTFQNIRDRDPSFKNLFENARADGLEYLADSLLTVVDDKPDVQKARVHSDNLKWLLSKRKPQIYGDRIELNVNQTVDIGGALAEAKRRALPQSVPDPILDPQVRDVTEVNSNSSIDKESIDAVATDALENTDDDIFK